MQIGRGSKFEWRLVNPNPNPSPNLNPSPSPTPTPNPTSEKAADVRLWLEVYSYWNQAGPFSHLVYRVAPSLH